LDSTAAKTLAAATAVEDQMFTFSEPATVVRIRGNIWVASDQASASEEPFGALGFAVVSDQAEAAGVAALPSPITDEASDLWFLYESFQAYFATGQGVVWQHYAFDSKAMRKLGDGETIVAMLENAHATFGLEYILKFRMLIKLHS
jgi:hypothetical protein